MIYSGINKEGGSWFWFRLSRQKIEMGFKQFQGIDSLHSFSDSLNKTAVLPPGGSPQGGALAELSVFLVWFCVLPHLALLTVQQLHPPRLGDQNLAPVNFVPSVD